MTVLSATAGRIRGEEKKVILFVIYLCLLKVQGPIQLHPDHRGHAPHQEVRGLLCQVGPEHRQSEPQRQADLHRQPRHQPVAGGPCLHVRGRRSWSHVLL